MPPAIHPTAELTAHARSSIEPFLRAAVDALPPRMRLVAGYHLGWWDPDNSPASALPPRKAVRPAFVLASARAVGDAPAEEVLSTAAAVELVHNFTLLHDDVMDRDRLRRHRPTAWTIFGTADALLAGDALQAAAFPLVGPVGIEGSTRLAACVAELCEGQHADLAFENLDEVSLESCLAMAEAKTGALLGCACALGALTAGAPPETVDALDRFGRAVGLAFQLTDDLLGIWGTQDRTGKPVGADLAARKKSLPVVAALNSGTTAGRLLRSRYRSDSSAGPEELAHLVEQAGGRAWATNHAAAQRDRSTKLLTDLMNERAGRELRALATAIAGRER